MARMPNSGLQPSCVHYLDWFAGTQTDRRTLYNILFKEPEASEAQRHLFEFLTLGPGATVPPIPGFPANSQNEDVAFATNFPSLHSDAFLYSFGSNPLIPSRQHEHALSNQLGRDEISSSSGNFPGQIAQAGPGLNLYQQMPHQQYSSNYLTHTTLPQHYPHLPLLTHVMRYDSGVPQPYYRTEEHLRPAHPLLKNTEPRPITSPMSAVSTPSAIDKKGLSNLPRSEILSLHQPNHPTTPYLSVQEMYGAVSCNSSLMVANVTGQPIILPPTNYRSSMYPPACLPPGELEHHARNLLVDITSDSSTGAKERESASEKQNNSNGCTSKTDFSPGSAIQPSFESSSTQADKPNHSIAGNGILDIENGAKEFWTASTNQQCTKSMPSVTPGIPNALPTKDHNLKAETSTNVDCVSETVDGINHDTVVTEHLQSDLKPCRTIPKLQNGEKALKSNPQPSPSASVGTNLNLTMSSSRLQPTGVTQRSWANIASSKTGRGSSSSPQIPTKELRPSHLENSSKNHLTPTASGSAIGITPNPHCAFDPASLSNETDPAALSLGEFLSNYQLNHHCVSLTHRGLVNQSNFCYINATLQSLLSCPPFVNLFRSMQHILGKKPCKATPILQSVFDFVMEFEPMSRLNLNKTDKSKRATDAFVAGPPLDPAGIRRVLSLLDGATFKVEGRQEDAEEFLSHLLNGIHDEMIKAIRWYEAKKECKSQNGIGQLNSCDAGPPGNSSSNHSDEGDTEWQVMGPRNKGSMTRKTEISKSPISEMFVGQMSSLLNRGNNPRTTTLQPFFTLQLDIQADNIHSVKDALEGLSTKEEVSEASGAGSGALIWKQLSLELLPVILVIHLKRFVYDKNCSKIFKLDKRVDFGIDLIIERELLSANCKSKSYSSKQRTYKLFAAIYHDGEETHKGHYIADTFHPSGGCLWGQPGWIRYDDSDTKRVTENQVLTPKPPRVPYLLYYRRVDTFSL